MSAIFSWLFHSQCQIICPINRIYIPISIQNVPPLLALEMPVMFSSCGHKAGPLSLTTADWVRNGHLTYAGLSWISLPGMRIHRAQVMDCQSAGLRDAGKSRPRQRTLLHGEQKHKAHRPRGQTGGPRKGESLGFWLFSSWFLSRACFHLHPWGQSGLPFFH